MKIMVPTVYAQVLLSQPLEVNGHKFAAGEILKIPYGVAIQAYALGTVKSIVDAENKHAEATKMLAQYGPDSWFPESLQSLARLTEFLDEKSPQNAPTTLSLH